MFPEHAQPTLCNDEVDGTKVATWETGNLGKENSVGQTARTSDAETRQAGGQWQLLFSCFPKPPSRTDKKRNIAG